jgi:hypothetical protein
MQTERSDICAYQLPQLASIRDRTDPSRRASDRRKEEQETLMPLDTPPTSTMLSGRPLLLLSLAYYSECRDVHFADDKYCQ